jgi:hypothetical protein
MPSPSTNVSAPAPTSNLAAVNSSEDFKLFRYHYWLGADVKLCAARLAMQPPAACIARLEAIEATLGEVFRSLKPYSLYPPSDYFKTRIQGGAARCPVPAARSAERGPLRPPLRAAA